MVLPMWNVAVLLYNSCQCSSMCLRHHVLLASSERRQPPASFTLHATNTKATTKSLNPFSFLKLQASKSIMYFYTLACTESTAKDYSEVFVLTCRTPYNCMQRWFTDPP